MLALGGDTGYIHIWVVVNKETMKSRYTEADRVDDYKKDFYSGPFTDADRIDDEVVVEPNKPCIILKLEEIIRAEDKDSSTTKVPQETSKSADAAESVVAAAEVSTTEGDRSNDTLSDKLASINQELSRSQTHE